MTGLRFYLDLQGYAGHCDSFLGDGFWAIALPTSQVLGAIVPLKYVWRREIW